MRAAIVLVLTALAAAQVADRYLKLRERMVRDQIQERGVSDAAVLRVMRTTPRHEFVPQSVRDMAYEDRPQPIGYEATISQPYIVAWMTEILGARKNHRVLEIGTGSGYQAAVLSPLVSHVYTIEIVPELAKSARETLRRLGYQNVTVRHGDGYKGWPEEAPFDRIIVTAAPPSIPTALTDQLVKGGRLVAPVGSAFNQELTVIDKRPDGSLARRSVGAVMFVPMRPGKN